MGDLWTDGVQWEEQSQDALTESTEKLTVFNTGAVRCSDADSERYDLITPVGLRRLAMTYARGASRYGARNWEKGIPASNLLNHAIRHIVLYMLGDKSEDHLVHAAWNLLAIVHFEEVNPELIDIPARKTERLQSQ